MSKRHFVALDGLRGVAAVVVMLFHIPHWAGGLFYPPGGYLAVDFFFMLSGFVIDYAYSERLRAGMPLRAFFRVRIIRLYPLIVASAAIGLFVVVLGRLIVHAGRFKLAAAFPFAVLGLPNPVVIDANHFVLNSPAWSLFFEIVANIGFSLFLFQSSTRQLIFLTAIFAFGLLLTAIHFGTIGFGDDQFWYWRGFMRIGFPFTMGMLINRIAPPTNRFFQFHSRSHQLCLLRHSLLFRAATYHGRSSLSASFLCIHSSFSARRRQVFQAHCWALRN